MSDRYSIFCDEEMGSLEVNAYLLTLKEAYQMVSELFSEGKTEITIMKMEGSNESESRKD